ncbi:hypothetical protein [Paenibacillus sp. GbtcB18]|uniref:hypothetical protein n=1 Tax=Paenibacillus sp. GbtcB18 TaxID=2824763 RepID=UPI001C30A66F|nr:hypothetical protein [Paenibacillus sp. GbtcB18]
MGRKSIGQRLESAKSTISKEAAAFDWAASWKSEHEELVRQLERAVRTNDYDLLCKVTGQLKAVHEKKFEALPKVLENLLHHQPE